MLRRNQAWPDFHSREGADLTSEQFYESPKLLGQLFRRVPVRRWVPQQWNGSRSPSDGYTVEMALYSCVSFRRLNLLGFGDPDEELTEEMSCLLDAYCERLLVIGQTHTITKNKNIHVSEAELVSGTIMADWSDHARRQAAVTAMNLQVRVVFNLCHTFLNDGYRRVSSSVRPGQSSWRKTRKQGSRRQRRQPRVQRHMTTKI
jgi:RNA-dependent RNA polymerase